MAHLCDANKHLAFTNLFLSRGSSTSARLEHKEGRRSAQQKKEPLPDARCRSNGQIITTDGRNHNAVDDTRDKGKDSGKGKGAQKDEAKDANVPQSVEGE